jgi:para-nitrobenzyl esterase
VVLTISLRSLVPSILTPISTSTSISHSLNLVCPLSFLYDARSSIAIGDLRFSPPKPAEYGPTINGTSYGPACLQSTPDYAGAFGDLVGAYGQSEDCLQLNVFVPRDVIYIATGLPVVVFVPGGGFFGGSANSVDGSVWLGTATSIVGDCWRWR